MQQEPQNSNLEAQLDAAVKSGQNWWPAYKQLIDSEEYQAIPVTPYVHTPKAPTPTVNGHEVEFKTGGLPPGFKAYRYKGEDWQYIRSEDLRDSFPKNHHFGDKRSPQRKGQDNLLALETLRVMPTVVEKRKPENVAPGRWQDLFHTEADFLNAPPLRFAIEKFLQEDAINMIGGLSGHGKTLIALAMTKALLEGGQLFDYFPVNKQAERVLYSALKVLSAR